LFLSFIFLPYLLTLSPLLSAGSWLGDVPGVGAHGRVGASPCASRRRARGRAGASLCASPAAGSWKGGRTPAAAAAASRKGECTPVVDWRWPRPRERAGTPQRHRRGHAGAPAAAVVQDGRRAPSGGRAVVLLPQGERRCEPKQVDVGDKVDDDHSASLIHCWSNTFDRNGSKGVGLGSRDNQQHIAGSNQNTSPGKCMNQSFLYVSISSGKIPCLNSRDQVVRSG
ncbi:unnamed protein product, partial [Urochloa humidicola]